MDFCGSDTLAGAEAEAGRRTQRLARRLCCPRRRRRRGVKVAARRDRGRRCLVVLGCARPRSTHRGL